MKKLFVIALTVLLLTAGLAAAQEAPVPKNSPRTPVHRQALPDRKPLIPPSSTVQGQAVIIDSEKLRIGDIDIRLFGVVPPQLSASYGPQARALLDSLVAGQTISCLIRDRDQSGRFLATCRTPNNTDLAYELLRRGLAVTARGSLASTDLATPYLAVEQAAQAQKAGLWSGIVPAPVPVVVAPVKVEAPAKVEAVLPPPPAPAPVVEAKPVKIEKVADKVIPSDAQVSAVAASVLAPPEEDVLALPQQPAAGFLMRYQLLVTGFIMLITALSILGVVSAQRRREKLDEMKAVAAALRGELMAARAVCQARLKTLTSEAEDKAMTWPRIRATLYQAYVGRLGWLGAELARQVASIYGQASDYAAYYNAVSGSGDDASKEPTPKRKALETLAQHIDEVLPKLALIEQTGHVTAPQHMYIPAHYASTHVSAPIPAPVTVEKTDVPPPTAVDEVTSPHPSAPPLWQSVQKFARDRFERKARSAAEEPHVHDYTALIEEEMANMTFGEAEEEPVKLPENVTKIRSAGS